MIISHYDVTRGVNYWFICPWWLEIMASDPQMFDTRTTIYTMREKISLNHLTLDEWRALRHGRYTRSDSFPSMGAVDILLLNAVSQCQSKCGLYKVTCFIKQSVDKKALLSSCTPITAACEKTLIEANTALVPAWSVVSPEMSLSVAPPTR